MKKWFCLVIVFLVIRVESADAIYVIAHAPVTINQISSVLKKAKKLSPKNLPVRGVIIETSSQKELGIFYDENILIDSENNPIILCYYLLPIPPDSSKKYYVFSAATSVEWNDGEHQNIKMAVLTKLTKLNIDVSGSYDIYGMFALKYNPDVYRIDVGILKSQTEHLPKILDDVIQVYIRKSDLKIIKTQMGMKFKRDCELS